MGGVRPGVWEESDKGEMVVTMLMEYDVGVCWKEKEETRFLNNSMVA